MKKEQNTLFLILKRQWFEMIASGEKKEEYRDYTKYWTKRLVVNSPRSAWAYKKFDTVTFQFGYAKNAPRLICEFKGMRLKQGRKKWGAHPGRVYFTIKLGEIISIKNI